MKVCYKTNQCVFTSSSYLLKSSGGRICRIEKEEDCPNFGIYKAGIFENVDVFIDSSGKEYLFKDCYSDIAGSGTPSIFSGEPLKKSIMDSEKFNFDPRTTDVLDHIKNYLYKSDIENEDVEIIMGDIKTLLHENKKPMIEKHNTHDNLFYYVLKYKKDASGRLLTDCPFGRDCKIGSGPSLSISCTACVKHINKDKEKREVECFGFEESK